MTREVEGKVGEIGVREASISKGASGQKSLDGTMKGQIYPSKLVCLFPYLLIKLHMTLYPSFYCFCLIYY